MPNNTESASSTKACPFCKEEILLNATKCKHCKSRLASGASTHEGICPFCKEGIHPDAIKCKHCGSSLAQTLRKNNLQTRSTPCGCNKNVQHGLEQSPELFDSESEDYLFDDVLSQPAPRSKLFRRSENQPINLPPGIRTRATNVRRTGPLSGNVRLPNGEMSLLRCRYTCTTAPCTRCIPGTDWCWESECCEGGSLDCEIGL